MLVMLVLQHRIRAFWEGVVEFAPSLTALTSEEGEGLEKLGQGGLGTVYNAYVNVQDLFLGTKINLASKPEEGKTEKVAFKVTQEYLEKGEDTDDFIKEARVMFYVYMLTHGRVSPRPYRSGMTPDGKGFIIMELLGADLLTVLKTENIKNITLDTRLRVYLSLLESLDSLHSLGIAHCDLKFENIIPVSGDNTGDRHLLKFIDFGMATSDRHCRGGTDNFLPPETLKSIVFSEFKKKMVDADPNWRFQSDIFSVGVMMLYFQSNFDSSAVKHNDNIVKATEDLVHEELKKVTRLLEQIEGEHLIPAAIDHVFDEAYENVLKSVPKPSILTTTFENTELNVQNSGTRDQQAMVVFQRIEDLINGFVKAALRPEPHMRPTTKAFRHIMQILSTIVTKVATADLSQEKINIEAVSNILLTMGDYLKKSDAIQASTFSDEGSKPHESSTGAVSDSSIQSQPEGAAKKRKLAAMSDLKMRYQEDMISQLVDLMQKSVLVLRDDAHAYQIHNKHVDHKKETYNYNIV